MAREPMPEYREGDVYQLEHKMRRILGFVRDRTRKLVVVYSTGGDKNRKCQLRRFHKFAMRGKCTHHGSGRSSADAT